jgi:hypothetical protein
MKIGKNMGRFETLSRPFRNPSAVIAKPDAKAARGQAYNARAGAARLTYAARGGFA